MRNDQASAFAPNADWEIPSSAHFVQFYYSEGFLLDAVSRFIAPAISAGEAALFIATKPHQDGLAELLRARGLNVTALRHRWLLCLDAAETLSEFMVNGWPDETRFVETVGGAIARAAGQRGRRQVRAFGEMVTRLYLDGKREAAIRLEELWGDLTKKLPFSLLCAYPIDAFRSEADEKPSCRFARSIPASSRRKATRHSRASTSAVARSRTCNGRLVRSKPRSPNATRRRALYVRARRGSGPWSSRPPRWCGRRHPTGSWWTTADVAGVHGADLRGVEGVGMARRPAPG